MLGAMCYIFQMGQNASNEGGYSSRDFFKRQVQFYRWRADPVLNTHIARVSFEPQAALKDREKLQLFLQDRTAQGQHISLAELAALSEGTSKCREELMRFEDYVCTLAALRQRLTLGEALYALQAMLGGYEVLLGKVGRVRGELERCFVTREGEVRAWLSEDPRSNDSEESEEAASSEMGLIKRTLELAEQLPSNHTEFLHFGRQFRSFMERDILQNWNFPNARRLVNGYAYAYKLTLPASLADAIARALSSPAPSLSPPPSASPSPAPSHLAHSSLTSLAKEEMLSTNSAALRLPHAPNSEAKRDSQRPLSHSDYSHSKPSSSDLLQHTPKTHSKKFSSTDLKNVNERAKGCESPKMSRSELIPNCKTKPAEGSVPTQRFRREREYAVVGEKGKENKQGKEEVRFSPMPNTFLASPALSGFHSVINEKEKATLKQKDGKKKLEKKVVTASKYAQFHHESRTLTNEQTSRNLPRPIVHFACEPPLEDGCDNSLLTHAKNKHSQPALGLQHKNSYDPTPPKEPLLQRGRTEFNRSQHSSGSQENTYSYPHCITVKTVNNLLDNEVSLHESNGSFMSLDRSQGSEYQGLLCQMGRSVDILNLPSNKQLNRKNNASNALINRSNS